MMLNCYDPKIYLMDYIDAVSMLRLNLMKCLLLFCVIFLNDNRNSLVIVVII